MQYYKLFPTAQIHLMIFEEFKAMPQEAMAELCDFLGIPSKILKLEKKAVNATKVPKMPLLPPLYNVQEIRKRLLKARAMA
jgi:hypothetical protein